MKIGILTFHRAYNFGALLQAYGLQQAIRSYGESEVEIIDYRNLHIERAYDYYSWHAIRRATWVGRMRMMYFMLIAGRSWLRRKRHFNDFVHRYLAVSSCHSTDIRQMDLSAYKAIVMGSDQIWNPQLTGGFDPAYWGVFPTSPATRKIAYAASAGSTAQFSPQQRAWIGRQLSNFNQLSVREDSLKRFCEQLTKKPVHVVLDPTLLAPRATFYQITQQERVVDFPYVLVYAVEMHPQLLDAARRAAQQRGARVVQVAMTNIKDRLCGRDKDIIKYDPTLPELLSLFRHAACTVTLSFHGVALSIVYEKDFYALRGTRMSRVNSLLTQLELTDRIIERADQVDEQSVDYAVVNDKLEKLRIASEQFLKESLKI